MRRLSYAVAALLLGATPVLAAAAQFAYPAGAARRRRRHVLRNAGRRSVSLDGRCGRAADHGVGESRGRSNAVVSRCDPAAHLDPRRVPQADRLPEGQRAVPSRTVVVLLAQHGAAESERDLRSPRRARRAARAARSEHARRGRHRCTRRIGVHARRQLDGVRDAVVGRRLGDVARQERRDGTRSAGHDPVEQVLRRRVGGQRRLLL